MATHLLIWILTVTWVRSLETIYFQNCIIDTIPKLLLSSFIQFIFREKPNPLKNRGGKPRVSTISLRR